MNNLNLNGIIIQGLTDEEMQSTNGGSWARIIEKVIWDALSNLEDIREGFSDGYTGKPRY